MKFDVEELSSVKKKINVVLPKEMLSDKIDKAYRKLAKTAKVKGFRPGKAPRSVLEKSYGGQVVEDVMNEVIQEGYSRAVEEKGLQPVSYPHFGGEPYREGEDYSFSLSLEVRPEIEPKDYKGIKITREKVGVADDEVNAQLEQMRKSLGTRRPVEGRGIEKGDFVTFDFEGFVDGKAMDRGRAEDATLEIGSGQFIPGFEDGMLGMKKGETGDVRATFPEDYHSKDVAGKEALFKVNIKNISSTELPALDDDLAKDLGDYKGLDELKERISADLLAQKEEAATRKAQGDIVDAIFEKNPFDVPDAMVQRRVDARIEEIRRQMAQLNMPEEDVAAQISAMGDELRLEAEKGVRGGILLEAVAGKEGIKVGEEDIEAHFSEMAAKSGRDVEEMKKHYGEHMEYLVGTLMDKKILDFLMSQAKIS